MSPSHIILGRPSSLGRLARCLSAGVLLASTLFAMKSESNVGAFSVGERGGAAERMAKSGSFAEASAKVPRRAPSAEGEAR